MDKGFKPQWRIIPKYFQVKIVTESCIPLTNKVQLLFQRSVPLDLYSVSLILFNIFSEENDNYMCTRLRQKQFG
jgi:hypothetical protein